MIKFHRNKRTGDYISEDHRFQIEKGTTGWNVLEWSERFQTYRYSFSTETLKAAKESCE